MATADKTAAKAAPAKTAAKTANKGGANVPALVKPKAGALATNELQEQLRKQAEAMAGRVQPPSGNKIQVTQAKQFKLPNGTTANEALSHPPGASLIPLMTSLTVPSPPAATTISNPSSTAC